MSKHLERDIEAVEQELLSMSAVVETMIDKSWRSLANRNVDFSREVIDTDQSVDEKEVRIEEECLKILALHQPVAIDLRRTATILKVNNDLERIADLAVNIAERTQRLATHRDFKVPANLEIMASSARSMLRDGLDALVRLDPQAALNVCGADDDVDQRHAEVVNDLYQTMRADVEAIAPAIHCLAVARYLERIADHATNIAEDVVYLVRGDIARHRHIELPDTGKSAVAES